MTIAVTGATGFIGSHVTQRLIAEGYEVCVIVRPSSVLDESLRSKVTVIPAVSPSNDLTSDFKKHNVIGIIHLAAKVTSETSPEVIQQIIDSNVTFGTQLLSAATQANLKWFINTGTFWQHFDNQLYSPVNLYAATKQAFEAIAQYYYETTALEFTTLKLNDTFGPGDTRKKIMNLFFNAAQTGTPLDLTPGDQILDINYIDNVIDAYLTMVKHLTQEHQKPFKGDSYVVSNPQLISVKELAQLFMDATGYVFTPKWGALPYRPREVMVSYSQGKTPPGWKPRKSLKQGIVETFGTNQII